MATISLSFDNQVNVSVSENANAASYDSVFMKSSDDSIHYIGDVTGISADRKTITITIDANSNPQIPAAGAPSSDYVFFVKKADVSNAKLTGYYAEVDMKNNSALKAELFAVGSEIAISSK
jgi:hypothetical protein|tara:strand:+ start:113 stop:475 length:363 start_codon:yes stop_codon:yes gene_type:complete